MYHSTINSLYVAIPGSGLPDQVSKLIIDNVTPCVDLGLASACDKI
jgi:hypothetical protein